MKYNFSIFLNKSQLIALILYLIIGLVIGTKNVGKTHFIEALINYKRITKPLFIYIYMKYIYKV